MPRRMRRMRLFWEEEALMFEWDALPRRGLKSPESTLSRRLAIRPKLSGVECYKSVFKE